MVYGEHTNETLRFLAKHSLTYVSIDGPRRRATVPSLPALASPNAVFSLHGRHFEGLLAQLPGKSPTVAEKYDHLYSEQELEEIARRRHAQRQGGAGAPGDEQQLSGLPRGQRP
jgi:uncharacterized protein YecE (DUF72 family)